MIVDLIMGVIVPFVLLVVAFYLIKYYRNDNVMKYVRIAVKSAEQIFNAQGQGEEKFKYVVDWVSKKFKISEDDLKNFIESAVYELNKENKSVE